MNKIKYISAIVLISLLGFSSCEFNDFFELTNPPEFPWLNSGEFERAAVSPYNYAFYSGWGGNYFVSDRIMWDIMSDEAYRIPEATASYPIDVNYFRQTSIDDGRNQESFAAGYNAIGLINSALDFYYAADGNPFPAASESDRINNVNRIAGELHFMRAFSYLHHALRHCPIPGTPKFTSVAILPLRENFTDAQAALNASFVTTDSIYSFIISDLKKAKELLPERYIEGVHHPSYQYGRVNKFAADAMLAKVYFLMNDFSNAAAELDTVIDMNGGDYSLDQDPIEAFSHSDPGRGHEVLWYALYYDNELGKTPKDFTLATFLDYRAVNGGHGAYFRRSFWHVFSLSNTFAQYIGWMDENFNPTEEALRDKRFTQLHYYLKGNRGNSDDNPAEYEQMYTNVKENRIWVDKYFRGPDGQFTNVPVIRLAELYLTRSVIRFMDGDFQGAADDLNAVRKRAWDEGVAGVSYESSDAFVTASSVSEEMINKERAREMSFEGDRLVYLEALHADIPPGERTNTEPVPFPYDGMYWTIPQDEIDFKLNSK